MASVGYTVNGKHYKALVKDEDDAREELVEFSSFAGKSAQAFGFAKASSVGAVRLPPLERDAYEGFFDSLENGGVVEVDEPVDNYLDFDTQKLVLDERTFDLEWLGRGGVVELPRFAQKQKKAYSEAVQDSLENKKVNKETGDTGVIWGERYAPNPQNVVSSIIEGSEVERPVLATLLDEKSKVQHRPMLDLDFPAALIPSTTPGHYHLYLDKVMTGEQYEQFIEQLHHFGILAKGNYGQVERHGATFLRLPWVKKGFLG